MSSAALDEAAIGAVAAKGRFVPPCGHLTGQIQ